jgi:hypothetical protein
MVENHPDKPHLWRLFSPTTINSRHRLQAAPRWGVVRSHSSPARG